MQKCMTKDKKVQILMSTYNGEKYLREQLDSFIDLDNFDDVKILVRDDGSTDNTVTVLEEYQLKYDIEIIKGQNVGVNKSIFELFLHCDLSCEYFALSDQDDVWLKNKLVLAIEKLSQIDNQKPTLFASLSNIVDEKLNPLGSSIIPKKGVSFYNAMIQNIAPGHTQVLNRALIKKIINKGIEYIDVIDSWVYLVAAGTGNVLFENKFTVLHRQHGKNSVGYELNFWRSTFNRIKRLSRNESCNITKQLKSFSNLYGNDIPVIYKEELERYFFHQQSFIKRLIYVLMCKAYRQTTIESCVFKCLYVIGKYKVAE